MCSNDNSIVRYICGYSKTPDVDGEYHLAVEYKLKPIYIIKLREHFDISLHETNLEIKNLLRPFVINQNQIYFLQDYIDKETLDINKYDYYLECFQSI